MKLVYLSNSSFPSRAANGIHVMKMCRSFAEAGCEVTLVARKSEEAGEEFSVDDLFESYGIERSFDLELLPRVTVPGRQLYYGFAGLRTIDRIRPDFVFGRDPVGVALSAARGWRSGLELHSRLWERSSLARGLLGWIFSRSSFQFLVVISEALKAMYLKAGYLDSDRIMVAHDGADGEGFESKSSTERTEGIFKVGYVGHLYEGRGVEIILESARALPTVDFELIGGRETDIERWKGESDLPNVRFLGFVDPAEVPRLRDGFDALLAPYQRETAVEGGGNTSEFMSPLKIFEYMASGKPMVVSDLPVLREVLSDEMAMLVAPDDPGAWVAAIETLRDDPAFAAGIAGRARRELEARYTWRRRAKDILDKLRAGAAPAENF